MVFRRRKPLSIWSKLREAVYPAAGFRRSGLYLLHRMRRLPDPPHRIARGIWAGVFVSFTPFFGLHFALAALIALILRGNVVAALLATAVGNPLTFPVIAVLSVDLGNRILNTGVEGVPASQILPAFAYASAEFWDNLVATFTSDPTHWDRMRYFFRGLFLPYLVGGIAPGVIAATLGYYLSLPMISAYQRLRQARRRARAETRAAPPPGDDP